jgi:hypothetical protein
VVLQIHWTERVVDPGYPEVVWSTRTPRHPVRMTYKQHSNRHHCRPQRSHLRRMARDSRRREKPGLQSADLVDQPSMEIQCAGYLEPGWVPC